MIEALGGARREEKDDFDWDAEADLLTSAGEKQGKKLSDLEKVATTDPLTGLLNRRAFQERVEKVLEQFRRERRGDIGLECISLLIIDIDHFKKVNDTFGHPEGDRILEQVASILKGQVQRSSDLVGRWGGEEFVVAFVNPNGVASTKAEEIRAAIEENIKTPDKKSVTISVGIAETTGVRDLTRLYTRADEALYEAKESGRNQVVVAGLLEDSA